MITADHNNGVHMIRHHDEAIDINVCVVTLEALQLRFSDTTDFRQLDLVGNHFTEDVGSLMSTDRDKVPGPGAVVPVTKPSGFNAEFVLKKGHGLKANERECRALIIMLALPAGDVASNVSTIGSRFGSNIPPLPRFRFTFRLVIHVDW